MDFNEIFEALKADVENFAKTELADYKDDAIKDAADFLEKTKDSIKNWTIEYAENKITKAELESLVAGQKELAELVLLKQKGLAQIKLDKFKTGLINTVLNTIIKLILL